MKNLALPAMYVLAIPLLLYSCSGKKESPGFAPPSNIIYIISDDQSWTDYSFMGHPHIATPHIDRLASEGLTFTRGYATAPLCRPSLASMATGLYPHQHKVIGNDPVFDFGSLVQYSGEWLAERATWNDPVVDAFEKLPTLPEMLEAKGYLSLQTGKWWEGNFSRGGFTEGMTHGDPLRGGRHGDEGLKIGREGLEVVFDFIRRAGRQQEPFFVWYAPFLPHTPHTPPDSLLNKYTERAPSPAVAAYWAMCEWFDITCGRLMDFIEEEGLAERTIFVYVTDNGWIQDPEKPNTYAPRSKRSPYEMGIRTPIIFRWPGTIKPALDTTSLVSSIDIATTLLEACDLTPAEGMQGINVLDKEKLAARSTIFAETYAHDFTSVDSSLYFRIALDLPWKLILPDEANLPDAEVELFNIQADPHERINMAEMEPGIVDDLKSSIEQWWEEAP